MKKPHVLNRSMFNQGGTSAYGKGITSNLVSDEQRQRFNYGGRVGFAHGLSALGTVNPYLNEKDWYSYDKEPWNTIERTIPIKSDLYSTASSQTDDDVMNEWGPLVEGVEVEDLFPSLGSGKRQVEKDKAAQERFESAQERFYPKEILEAEVEEAIPPPLPTDTDSDVLGAGIDWEKFAEGLYDKKGARGKAMLGLAGNVLAASQLPKKEAAVLLGKGMGEFGKTWASRKEKMEDIAATGKMYETIYKTREEEKGKQARLTAEAKTAPSTPKEKYDASISLVLAKDQTPSDGAIASAFWDATRVNPIILKGGTKEADLKADEAAISGADEKDVFLLNREWHMKIGGKLVPITEEIALKLKG